MRNRTSVSESTPLVTNEGLSTGKGHASFQDTVITMVKTCMGTAMVGLAFACRNSGCVIYVVGMFAIAVWNAISVERLCGCLDFMQEDSIIGTDDMASNAIEISRETNETSQRITPRERPPEGMSMLGKVAWYSFGRSGLYVFDIMMLTLFFGIAVAYQSAIISFFSDTPLSMGPFLDSIVGATIIGFFSLVPDLGYLARASAAGLAVLAATFAVVVAYGVHGFDRDTAQALPLWPDSLTSLSKWFGVSVFGYGIVPLTYNYREAMREPDELLRASIVALACTATSYIFIGIGLLFLFPETQGEILHELPLGFVPVVTRLAMTSVILVTAPLLVVPCSELIEGKFHVPSRTMVRFGVVYLGAVCAWFLPSFVAALDFVGGACVGAVSFCLPPLFHLRLAVLAGKETSRMYLVDGILLAWGIIATIWSTSYTFHRQHRG